MCPRSSALHRDDANMSSFLVVTSETITQHLWLEAYIENVIKALNAHSSMCNSFRMAGNLWERKLTNGLLKVTDRHKLLT